MARKLPPPEVELHPLLRHQGDKPKPVTPVILEGYLGKAKDDEYVHLYTDRKFEAYYEVPKSAILAQAPTDPNDPISPTRVYLEPTAKLKVGKAPTFQGRIFKSLFTAATIRAAGAPPEELEAEAGVVAKFSELGDDPLSDLIGHCS